MQVKEDCFEPYTVVGGPTKYTRYKPKDTSTAGKQHEKATFHIQWKTWT